MTKKNVLIVMTVSLDMNGISISTLELLAKADKNINNFLILSAKGSNPETEKLYVDAGCKIIKLEFRNKRPLSYIRRLRKVIRENSVNVVHAMGNSATLAMEMVAAAMEKVPLRISHSHNTTCSYKFIDKLLRPVFYKNCNCRLACGNDAGKWLFENRDFTVLKNGKDYFKYAFSDELREKYRLLFGCGKNTLLVGHVGVFNRQKNHSFMVDIVKQAALKNDDVKFVFIGDGSKREDISDALSDGGLKDKVVFTGNIQNVNEVYSAFDIMILPSLHEGLPGVVTEWQINGLPCLISDRVTKECRFNDNVLFLPIDDAALWADEILSGKYRRITDGDAIRENLKKGGFDLDENAAKLSDIYEKGRL